MELIWYNQNNSNKIEESKKKHPLWKQISVCQQINQFVNHNSITQQQKHALLLVKLLDHQRIKELSKIYYYFLVILFMINHRCLVVELLLLGLEKKLILLREILILLLINIKNHLILKRVLRRDYLSVWVEKMLRLSLYSIKQRIQALDNMIQI